VTFQEENPWAKDRIKRTEPESQLLSDELMEQVNLLTQNRERLQQKKASSSSDEQQKMHMQLEIKKKEDEIQDISETIKRMGRLKESQPKIEEQKKHLE